MNIQEQIEELRNSGAVGIGMNRRAADTIERLNAIYEAAKRDLADAKHNCGKHGGERDCTAYTSRGLRCSDCPVEVWLGETFVAVTQTGE